MAANQLPIADKLLALLPASPNAYPHTLDLVRDAILVIQMDAAAYRAASFLDDRILSPATQGAWLPVAAIGDAARREQSECAMHFIFHTGHVGSTLVSRLLDETGDVLSLREPLPLRTLADAGDVLNLPESLLSVAQFGDYLGVFTKLWSRGYAGDRAVVVKATSSAGRLAIPLLEQSTASRATYMNLRAESFLATLLAGQNSPLDLRGHGPGRIRRLQARVDAPLAPLHELSVGEMAALGWLAESWTQRDVLRRFPDRVIALDFDDFLRDVPEGMRRVLAHFGLPCDPRFLSGLVRSPVLTRYSKAPEHAYTPDTRAQLVDASRRANRDEIRQGLTWLERLARSDDGVAAVVHGAGF